ncbi:MAG: cupin domain-containing protein [Chlorobi bacterium]|nr:cupin domain-containing protein [Chlorobiota bacterium]
MSKEKYHIKNPTLIKAEGNKIIEEFIGNVNTRTSDISIARMKSPPGWQEPPQQPDFDEYTLVLKGALHVQTGNREFIVNANEAFIAKKGTEIRYSTPGPEGAEYIAVCLPAFSPDTVHRKE